MAEVDGSGGNPGEGVSSQRVVVGLDFGGTKIAVAVVDASGEWLGETTVAIDLARTTDGNPARGNLAAGIEAAKGLLDSVAPGAEVVALGACTFGIPTPDRIHLAPAIPGWEDLALESELRAAFPGSEVRTANDVKAAAAAEARFGALVGHDPGIYVNLGTGLAVAIVTGGRVVDGAHGAAGEIAYNLRTIDDLEVPSGERILLEEVVSGRAIAMRATALADRPLTAAEVLTTSGFDDGSNRLLEEFLWELSYHLVNLAVALDPARIVVGGGMVRSWARLEPRLRAALDAGVPFPPELTVARFPFDAPLVGAIALACEVAACESAAPDIVTSAASRIEEAAESGAPSSGRAGVTASRMAGGENRRNGAGDVRGGTPGDFQGELRRNGAAAQTGRHSGNIGTRRGI